MKYTLILVAENGAGPKFGTDDWNNYAAEYGKFNEDAGKAGGAQRWRSSTTS